MKNKILIISVFCGLFFMMFLPFMMVVTMSSKIEYHKDTHTYLLHSIKKIDNEYSISKIKDVLKKTKSSKNKKEEYNPLLVLD